MRDNLITQSPDDKIQVVDIFVFKGFIKIQLIDSICKNIAES